MLHSDSANTPAIEDMIEAFPLPTLVISGAGTLACMNAAAEVRFGKRALGRHLTTSLRHPKLVDAVELSLLDRAPRKVSFQVVENGNDVFYDVHLRAIAGTPLLILSFQNATEVVLAEQMRSDFVANVSHELRTPLTSLMGFIETLQGPARNDANARDRFLTIMSGEAERMNRLVGDLQSLSGVEAGEHVRPKTIIDVRDILQTMLSNIAPLAQDSGVALRCDLGEIPMQVTGDSDQLIQVFTNLVENAIKYGGGGDQAVQISVSVETHDPVLRGPAVAISVSDHGPGIDPIHLPRLTERFYRVDSHRSRQIGGTGLGLSIVKHILNRHRGRLKVDSQLGEGSQFTVILPSA
ncbi:MAG: ATP-binding protein [Litoreibacter sp.]|uniref:sensor histidine kinase n=1 Tax=Litoreibacter sp. TaxID=1969459 RepID=UPI003299DA59